MTLWNTQALGVRNSNCTIRLCFLSTRILTKTADAELIERLSSVGLGPHVIESIKQIKDCNGYEQFVRQPFNVLEKLNELKMGMHVQILGLIAKPEFNGLQGKLMEYISSTKRWVVRIDETQQSLKIKPCNLKVAGDSASSALIAECKSRKRTAPNRSKSLVERWKGLKQG